MKTITKIAALALVLGTTTLIASSDDYALTDNYKLLNDMNLAKKQQSLIVDMNSVLDADKIDTEALNKSTMRFSKVLSGLSIGNNSLKLRGTKVPAISAKLSEVQKLWKEELMLLNNLKSSNKDKAISKLNTIMIKMSQAVSLYNNSYSRFKQKSKLSSIVNRHMNSDKEQLFAFNVVQ